MTAILAISVALIMGLLMTRILRPLKLPDVTAYLIAGVLIGPYVLGRLNIPGIGFVSTSDVEQYALIQMLHWDLSPLQLVMNFVC
ncbi:MAG: hypothetical protein ACLUVN_06440, partial [Frisingicoccus sp.]